MKIMISQPMNGKTEEDREISAAREVYVKLALEAEGHEIIDTVFTESPEEVQNTPVWYLSKSIETMSMVDAIYFLPGWENARCCKLEHQIAEAYGIKILTD